jgi:pimeloyl-ACP methyl ester carboxylesterase
MLAAAPYPPPGTLVDVGGYRVHLYCTGEGSPTVVMAGTEFSFDWALVQPRVAAFTRICTYDPSGTAWSDPGPSLTCAARVRELHAALKNAGVEGPYVVVGLSVGAITARLYANRYPKEMAGMVIVDHAFLDTGGKNGAQPSPAPAGDAMPVLIHQEPIRWTIEDDPNFSKLPKRSQELHRWAMSLHPMTPTMETAEECLAAVAKSKGSLGDRPLAVISTVPHPPSYYKLQAELLALSSNSKQFVAEKSFHAVTIDQPEIIVSAIHAVIDALRRHSPLTAF